MHSLASDNPEDEKEAFKAITKGEPGQIIDLPTPPDHIIVDIKPQLNIQWPQHLNFFTRFKYYLYTNWVDNTMRSKS